MILIVLKFYNVVQTHLKLGSLVLTNVIALVALFILIKQVAHPRIGHAWLVRLVSTLVLHYMHVSVNKAFSVHVTLKL